MDKQKTFVFQQIGLLVLPRQPYSDSAALGSSWAPGQQKVLNPHLRSPFKLSNIKATTVKTYVVMKHQLRSPFKFSNNKATYSQDSSCFVQATKQHETDDRLLVSDYETGDFYGFNTTYFTK